MREERFDIEGLICLHPKRYADERGYFFEYFHQDNYTSLLGRKFLQDNVSLSRKGVLRGLHFQTPPFAQGKLVQVLSGSVLDVAVDLRKESSTYGKFVLIELSAENGKQFYIPPGFAHGFLTLEENTLFSYKCTEYYAPTNEETLLWNDPHLKIPWPINHPLISDKDQKGILFANYNSPF
ncbi:MAG: dTDP-4-dehydrorhamnose 3,5-epimerase [Bacteroidota bacterium]|jgi:dTDP-4-dehydrorhamnose 3,5-epimerase|nr:dTDP-4-dehydrorhamnose 3,5-epimerase [Flavobacteriia bacterium]